MAAETRTELISLSDIKNRSSIDFNFIENGVPLSGFESSDGPPICTVQSVSGSGVTIEVTTFFEGRLCQTPFRITKDVKALAQIVENLGQGKSGPMRFVTISDDDTNAGYLEDKLLDGEGVELVKTVDSTGGTDENLTINARRKNSIVIDEDQLQLENDVFNKIIDGEGLLGTINTSSNGSEELNFSIQTKKSIEIDNDFLQLDGDETTPGNFKHYGTNLSGTKGWIPSNLIRLSATDLIPDYVENKIVDGNGILTTLSEDSVGDQTLDFSVRIKNSIEIDSDELQLVNDETLPGSFKRYGTNSNGEKGWTDSSLVRISSNDAVENYLEEKFVSGNATTFTTTEDSTGEEFLNVDVGIKNSVEVDSNEVQFVNDELAPGNSKFYGTTVGGVKGWQDLPTRKSIIISENYLQLHQDQTDPGTNQYYGTDNSGAKGFHTLPAVVAGALFTEGSIDLQIDTESNGDYYYTTSLINDEETADPYHYYGTAENDVKGWQSLGNLPNEIALGGLVDEDSTGTVDYPVMRRCSVHPSTGAISNIGTSGDDIALSSDGINADQQLIASKVWNATWNDIADFQDLGDKLRYGKCYTDTAEEAKICTTRCQKGVIGIASDTFGYALGVGENKVPIAISGWVLAYVDKEYERGTPLTNDKHGNLTEMVLKEKQNYPERLVAVYKKKETSIEWGTKDSVVKVNGRHWVKVKG